MAVIITHVSDPCEVVPRFYAEPGQYWQQTASSPLAAVFQLLEHCSIEEIHKLRVDGIGRVLRSMTHTQLVGEEEKEKEVRK